MKSVAKIGFQLSDANVHAVTGYCAAEMAIEKANQTMDLPFEINWNLSMISMIRKEHAKLLMNSLKIRKQSQYSAL